MSHILDATSPLSAERQLLLAVLHRSLHDLKPNAPAQDRHASVAFFSNADGHLQTVCDLLDLDCGQVQAGLMKISDMETRFALRKGAPFTRPQK